MEARLRTLFHSWWHIIKKRPYTTGIVLFLALILFIFLAYWLGWIWTGLNSGTIQIAITSTSKGNYTATIPQPSKSLWDWLQLLAVLAIPIVVGIGAAWYTAQQGKVSDRENTDNQRETALQAYFDKMAELLLHEKMRDSAVEDEVRSVGRVLTLTVLLRLDTKRKRIVLQFLYESGLIKKDESIIDLRSSHLRASELNKIIPRRGFLSSADVGGADLRGADLRRAYLVGADLSGADLSRANLKESDLEAVKLFEANLSGALLLNSDLRGADLHSANFRKAFLSEIDLKGANLKESDFREAEMRKADISGTDLSTANLSGADLKGANLNGVTGITVEELEKQAASLKGATMPDGSKHP